MTPGTGSQEKNAETGNSWCKTPMATCYVSHRIAGSSVISSNQKAEI